MPTIDWDQLTDELKPLAGEIFEVLKEGAKDYIDEQGVVDFLKDTSARYAKWKWKAMRTDNPALKAEYEENLRDVAAQVDIEIARHAIVANDEIKKFLIQIAKMAGGMLLKIGPKLLGLPI